MANTYRHTGRHIPVASASGAITSGAFVVQEGWFGVAITSAATGASLQLDTMGVHVIAVPSGTVKGDLLYITGAITAASDIIPAVLTKTAASNTLMGKAVGDRDSAGNALVKLVDQP